MFDTKKPETCDYFLGIMKHYMTYYGADGFRCDVCEYVPISFWESARRELEKIKPDMVMIAESDLLENTCYAFDANYGWEICTDVVKALVVAEQILKENVAKLAQIFTETSVFVFLFSIL